MDSCAGPSGVEGQSGKSFPPLPRTIEELEEEWLGMPLTKKWKRKDGLSLSNDARKIGRRSLNRSYLLLVGETGVGKSSTVNHLFGQKLCEMSDARSETRSTTEWVLEADDPSFKSKLSLSIVDSPGLGDTDGNEQSARNLESMRQFFRLHGGHTVDVGVIPNVIFIAFKSVDNRFEGPQSMLAKCFKALRTIDLIDEKTPNVVVVLTHAGSLGAKSRWKTNLDKKIQLVKRQAGLHLGFVPEVVAMENVPEDFDYPVKGPWTELPDGTLQPLNLYQAILSLVRHNGDRLTHAAVNRFLIDSETNAIAQPRKARWVDATSAGLNEMEQSLLTILVGDVPTLAAKPEVQLPLQPPKKVFAKFPSIALRVGESYDVLHDKFTSRSVFTFEGSELQETECGWSLPAEVWLLKSGQTTTKMETVDSREEYIKQRLNDLGVRVSGKLNKMVSQMNVAVGYNMSMSNIDKKQSKTAGKTFLLENRIFQLRVIQEKAQVNMLFQRDVGNLPLSYDKTDGECVAKFQNFLNAWGHYVIIGAFVGGSVEGRFQSSVSSNSKNEESLLSQELQTKMQYLSNGVDIGQHFTQKDYKAEECSKCINNASLTWSGGDSKYHKQMFHQMTPADWSAWEASLRVEPCVLRSELTLLSISEVVRGVRDGDEKALAVASALRDIFEDSLTGSPGIPMTVAEAVEPVKKSKCFPADALVVTREAPEGIKMIDLKLGDEVLSVASDGSVVFTQFYMWIHRAPTRKGLYLEVRCDRDILHISPNHLIFRGKAMEPILAGSLKENDCVLILDPKSFRPILKHVSEIKTVTLSGVLAPATLNGRILVNGFAVSCYANAPSLSIGQHFQLSSQFLSHAALTPLRIAHRLDLCPSWLKEGFDEESGIHKYCLFLAKYFMPLLHFLSGQKTVGRTWRPSISDEPLLKFHQLISRLQLSWTRHMWDRIF